MEFQPYLNFNGNTEEAFNFYKSVFGGDFKMLQRFSETPEGDQLPEGDRNKIMHIALPLGSHTTLMGTDALESMGQQVTQGNNFYLSVHPDSKEKTDELFQKLADGGEVEMELQDTFWGAYFGMCKDRFGVQWMLNYENNN